MAALPTNSSKTKKEHCESPKLHFITPIAIPPPFSLNGESISVRPSIDLKELELKIIEDGLDKLSNLNIEQNQTEKTNVKITSITRKKKVLTKTDADSSRKSDILLVNSEVMDIKSEISKAEDLRTIESDIRNYDITLPSTHSIDIIGKMEPVDAPYILDISDIPDTVITIDDEFLKKETLPVSEPGPNCSNNKPLSIDVLNENFEVVTNLQKGKKLQIADGIYFKSDDRHAQFLARYLSGDSKDAIADLMEHMYSETERHVKKIREDIRQNICVDINITLLHGFLTKMHAFVHTLDNVKSTYENHSNICAKFNIIKAKFLDFSAVLFRELILSNSQ
jgi:hypothetical protein